MSLQGLFYGYMADPTAAKGTLPPSGQIAFFVDNADNHFKMVDSAGTVTDLTDTSFSSDFSFDEGVDVSFGTSAGTKFGTASQQKIGFFGVTPVVKASAPTAADATAIDGTYNADEQGVLSNVRVRLNEVVSAMQGLGFIN